MVYKDGGEFTTYCDKLYDRHLYKLVFKNGVTETLDNYMDVRYFWNLYKEDLKEVIVLDKKQSPKGF